jgi:hypothetical protein
MERILKEQFVNVMLILCEFEKDFANEEGGNVEEVHSILQTVTDRTRDIMADYCFEQYDWLDEVLDDEAEMLVNIFEKCAEFEETVYIPYLTSMFDIVAETINEFSL